MCIKALNPSAQEWRPTSHHLHLPPRVIFAPPSPPPQAAVPPPPPHKLAPFYNPLSLPIYHHGFILCNSPCRQVPQLPVNYQSAPGNFCEVKSPKRAQVDVGRRFLPPRQRRAVWSFSVDRKKPTCKQEWRPKKSAGGGGGTATSPPLVSSDCSKPLCAEEISSTLETNTTVMIKNIPNQLRRDFMLEFLDGYCKEYSLEYDFFYLPMDFRKKDNLGYAFVNFTTGGAAMKFKEILHNYKWETVKNGSGYFTSKKICEITWARIQGKNELLNRFQYSKFACDKLDFLPVVLNPPRNGSDPIAQPVTIGKLHNRVFSKI